MKLFMNLAQKKNMLVWKLNKEQKSTHPATVQVKYAGQKYEQKKMGNFTVEKNPMGKKGTKKKINKK